MTEYNTFQENSQLRQKNHPATSMILLLALVFAASIVFSFIAIAVGLVFSGEAVDLSNLEQLLSGASSQVDFIKIVQAISSAGMFMVPALLLGAVEKHQYRYLDFKAAVPVQLWLVVVALMFFSTPVFDYTIRLNQQMELPAALAELEDWMETKEAELAHLTKLLLADTQFSGLLVNLLVVAVIPAIGEEFIFRGCVQGILSRWFKNPHAAIWVTAIVFSAIHLQFYGFLPRMLLGALFGYLLFWGKNIWLPVFAHFLNNAAATVSAFYLRRQGRSLDEMDFSDKIPAYLYFFSFVLAVVLLFQYYRMATAQKIRHHGEALD